jgi:predicted ester cyclase
MTSIGEQIIHRFVATLNERDFDGFEALFVDDYQQHQALATNGGSPAAKHGVRAYYQDRITAFPDMVVTAQPYLVTDEHVAVNFVYAGTHRGTYLDIAPTGRKVTFNSTDIMRIRGHELAEHWGAVDLHGLLQQLTKK